MSRFDACLPVILAAEGGYCNVAGDAGGATRFGICTAVARANGYTGDMRDLPLSVAALIYNKRYWDAVQADHVPAPADLVVFDAAVNGGVDRAIKQLQTALGVTADGAIGPHTLEVLALANGKSLAHSLLDIRQAFYEAIVRENPGQDKFLAGWLNRVKNLRTLCG